MSEFSKNLTKSRERLNITRNEMAHILGVTVQTYGAYENGKREPSLEKLRKIAAALHVSIDELLGYSISSVEIQAALARHAGLAVQEDNGLYSVSVPPETYKRIDGFYQLIIDNCDLAPLPAAEFDRAVKMARQQVVDEHTGRFILLLCDIINEYHKQPTILPPASE